MRLHGFSHFYIHCFANSTYGFPFRTDKFEWYELDVCEFVSVLVEMLWYGIGGLVLYASTVLSESVNCNCNALFVCPIYSAGAPGMFLRLRHWIM